MPSSDDRPDGGAPSPEHPDRPASTGVSRRSFLQSVGVTSLAAGVTGARLGAQAGGAIAVGPGPVPVTLTINGERQVLELEPRVTLLDALRTRLDLTGAKRVCDRGSCGACTVLVDGRPMYACSLLAIEVQGSQIRTVESFTTGAELHPVQRAFCEADALMCGFCTPGFVTAAVALLERVPNPTAEQARAALDGNICRCGTYTRLLEAALKAGGGSRG
jgi:xanthine dehydrogenase YagT iron-sulfur-binding subunit